MSTKQAMQVRQEAVLVPPLQLEGTLSTPDDAFAVIAFAHGSGSSRSSPRNRAVAQALNQAGLATLMFDLLTEREASDRANVFDIPLLAERLIAAINYLRARADTARMPIGLFGASTGAAAALIAAARRPAEVAAVVSRGGRPDLAGDHLARVTAPTLLIIGGSDTQVLALNRAAQRKLAGPSELAVIQGATHLFEEAGALEEVARLAANWFVGHAEKARSDA